MCSHYQTEKRRKQIEKLFRIKLPLDWEAPPGGLHIYPTQFAPIIRRPAERDAGDEAVPDFELVEARFGLLPSFARDEKFGLKTYNARSETAATLPSFRVAWEKARHCIVPCQAIYEPDWRTGTHVPTRFTAANDETLGVAGLWQPWKSPRGDWVATFTMLTVNADDHDLMKHFHRPDAKRPLDQQDKRMVVVLPEDAYEAWLDAPPQRSIDFMRQYPANRLIATPEQPPPRTAKPAVLKASVPPTQALLF